MPAPHIADPLAIAPAALDIPSEKTQNTAPAE
jgi:hypothetical protein